MNEVNILIFFILIYAIIIYKRYYDCWVQLPEPFSFIFTWFAAVPLIVWLALTLTNAIIKDFVILKVWIL